VHVVDLPVGPFLPGQEFKFKMHTIKYWARIYTDRTYFCIETSDTVSGFPDVLGMGEGGGFYELIEFKVSNAKGVIEFQRSQPMFYKDYAAKLPIHVLAYDVPRDRVIRLETDEVVKAKSLRMRLSKAQ
jgi:hypothetical protein